MDAGLGRSAVGGASRRGVHATDVGFAVVLAGLLLPVTARTIWASSWPPALEVAGTGAVVVGQGVVAVRRRVPRAAFAVGGVTVLFLVAAPPLDPGRTAPFSAVLLPSVAVYPVLLYTVAAWCPRRTSLWALALSLVGGLLVVVRLWGADYLTVAQPGLASADQPVRSWPLFLAVGLLAAVVLPWCAGEYRRLRVLYVLELEERARREDAERLAQARRAVEEDRRRIAREMHDVVAHSLSVMVSQAEGGRLLAAEDPAAAAPVLDTIARAGREAMRDMSSVLHVLESPEESPGESPEGSPGLVEDPQPGLADLPALVTQVRRSGVPVLLEEAGAPTRLSGAAGLAAYRVAQEALTNVLKHAGPGTQTHVAMTWRTGALELEVRNQLGSGSGSGTGSGRGLRGMEERVSALGGSLRVTASTHAFVVRALIPTGAEDR